jgi:hypothetical protein
MERLTPQHDPDRGPRRPAADVDRAAQPARPAPQPFGAVAGSPLIWKPPGRGGDLARFALVQQLQRTQGNQATARLLAQQPRSAPHPIQRGRFGTEDPPETKERPGITSEWKGELRQHGRDFRARQMTKTRASAKERRLHEKRITQPEYPTYEFSVVDEEEGINERHRIFVGTVNGDSQLMIASYPMPVATFITEMRARFNALVAEANRGIKKPRGLTAAGNAFTTSENKANARLVKTNAVFANVLSSAEEKRQAERKLALKLDPVIKKVIAFAKRLGQHFSVPGNAPLPIVTKITSAVTNAPDPGYYHTALAGAAERYNVEGMVAHYQDLPDYEGSGFDRDHQPHNDLIETVAQVPEFGGTKIQTVAAGRTLQGWAIMLQHTRHAAGRTFGNKGGTVTSDFTRDLGNERARLGVAATPHDIRQYCIDYLVQSMKDDVAAMKAVAADDSNYTDMAGMSHVDKARYKARVKNQVDRGEDRILATEDSIRTYDQ